MASTKQTTSAQFPPLRIPATGAAKSGKAQTGDSSITAQFPPLRVPPAASTKPGKVQLGDSSISAQFPFRE